MTQNKQQPPHPEEPTKKKTTPRQFQPVLICKNPITPGEPPQGEVSILLICSTCGKGISNLTLADLILDIDVFQPPGPLIDSRSDSNELTYSLTGTSHIVHIDCDTSIPGVRINAGDWTANRGRTRYRPVFADRKKESIN